MVATQTFGVIENIRLLDGKNLITQSGFAFQAVFTRQCRRATQKFALKNLFL